MQRSVKDQWCLSTTLPSTCRRQHALFPQRPADCRFINLNPCHCPSGWRSITWVQLLLNVALVEQSSSALDEKLTRETRFVFDLLSKELSSDS